MSGPNGEMCQACVFHVRDLENDEEEGECYRYPKAEIKHRSDWCGEHRPQPTGWTPAKL